MLRLVFSEELVVMGAVGLALILEQMYLGFPAASSGLKKWPHH